jgi:hypothetical protein
MSMVMIKVPKTPKSAFNPDRPASSLIQAQIEHLEAAAGVERRAVASVSSVAPGRARRAPIREGEAAAYIARLTSQLQPGMAKMAPGEAAAPSRELSQPTIIRRCRKASRKAVKAVKAKSRRKAKPAAPSKASPRKKATARARKKGR